MKINRISPDEHDFLKRCNDIAKKPQTLYFIGILPEEPIRTAAIVGTRRPTAYGRAITERISSALAGAGVTIISGMALGIDAIAHQATLDAGGRTIAVLPGGVDTPYPRTNFSLAQRIVQNGGALISEYPPGTEPRQYNFLERNRIVSALADVVIVTEAATKSGTLSTVAHALEQGKTVFAVPGNITSPLSSGCNQLIKQGASVVTDPNDILEELQINTDDQLALAFGDNSHETALINLMKAGVQDGDTLLLQSRLSASDYNQAMTMLEIKGIIKPLGANCFALITQ